MNDWIHIIMDKLDAKNSICNSEEGGTSGQLFLNKQGLINLIKPICIRNWARDFSMTIDEFRDLITNQIKLHNAKSPYYGIYIDYYDNTCNFIKDHDYEWVFDGVLEYCNDREATNANECFALWNLNIELA